MADATVAVDRLQALEVLLKIAAKVAFDQNFLCRDGVDDRVELLGSEVFCADVWIHIGGFEHFLRVARADAVDVWERCFDALVAGNINAENAGHGCVFCWLVKLALALFVARVFANDAEDVLALDDAAGFTLPFD